MRGLQSSDMFLGYIMTLQRHFVQRVDHVDDILHDDRIGYHVYGVYSFLLLHRVPLPDGPITTKTEPSDEIVVGFSDSCRCG